MAQANLRIEIAQVLLDVEQGRSLAQVMPEAQQRVGDSDRAGLQALSYGACRWFYRLEAELATRLKRPLRASDRIVHHLLITALFQLRHSERADYAVVNEAVEACRTLGRPHLTGLVNGVLRSAQRDGEPAEITGGDDRFSHPSWMTEKLRHNWPEHWQSILDANNRQGPMTLRVNQARTNREQYRQQLAEVGIESQPTDFAPHALQLTAAVPVTRLPYFEDGLVSVQDEAAQLCTDLLQLAPGQRVLDACAAPGGKTCAILEACPGLAEVVAVDSAGARLPRLEDNLRRLDLAATVIEADAGDTKQWWDGRLFDRILLDAPCSGSGVIRRHPDIKMLRRETDLPALASIQLELLERLWQILAPGGRLVYATCSVFPQENHRIIQRFIKSTADARLGAMDYPWGIDTGAGRQLFPNPQAHDGFFYASLDKESTS